MLNYRSITKRKILLMSFHVGVVSVYGIQA